MSDPVRGAHDTCTMQRSARVVHFSSRLVLFSNARSGIVVAVFLRIAMLLVLAGLALAVLIPVVGSTASVVAVIVIAVLVIGLVIFIWSQGGSGFQGGWRGRGPMG